MADVYLTQRDIDYISRVVATEVPASLQQTDPEEYSRMVNAVVDTMANRVASDAYPDTITDVANQSRQFSKITGPASLDPYGSVQATPKASAELQNMVAGRIADLAQGAESEIGGALSYANPNFSDASNLASWVNPMIEAGALELGFGQNVHFHGLAPGQQPVGDYTLTAEGIPSGNIPVPYGPNDDPFAMSAQAQATDGFSGLANPVSSREPVEMADLPAVAKEPGEWGVINGVGPVYTPTFNQWDEVASAPPVQAPMSAVVDQGVLSGVQPAVSADVASAPAAGVMSGIAPGQPISQEDVSRAFFNPTGAGDMDPAFTAALMSSQNPVVPTAVQSQTITPGMETATNAPVEVSQTDIATSRFSTPAKTARIGQEVAMDAARMPGLIDPNSLTQSFATVSSPADIAGFAEGYDAQRGPTSGLLSADMDIQRGNVERQLQNPIAAPSGVLAGIQQPNVDNTATGSTTPGLYSHASMTAASPTLTGGFSKGLISEQPINQVGFFDKLSPDVDINLSSNIVPAAAPQIAAPSLETVEVAEQPTVASQTATVEGPATTSAVEQQVQSAITDTTPAARTTTAKHPSSSTLNKGVLANIPTKEAAIGGVLAGLGLGPVGIPAGVLAGAMVANGGGLTGLLNGPEITVNNIGTGPQAAYSVWGGAQPVGTQATASNGANITSLPGGVTAYTSPAGVTTAFDKSGKAMGYFGSAISSPEQDEDSEAA